MVGLSFLQLHGTLLILAVLKVVVGSSAEHLLLVVGSNRWLGAHAVRAEVAAAPLAGVKLVRGPCFAPVGLLVNLFA